MDSKSLMQFGILPSIACVTLWKVLLSLSKPLYFINSQGWMRPQKLSNQPVIVWYISVPFCKILHFSLVNKNGYIFQRTRRRSTWSLGSRVIFLDLARWMVWLATCPPNVNDVFRIGRSEGIIFFHSGQPIGSVDMCLQIEHVRFFDFLDFKVD